MAVNVVGAGSIGGHSNSRFIALAGCAIRRTRVLARGTRIADPLGAERITIVRIAGTGDKLLTSAK
jgi:hypothetical protein